MRLFTENTHYFAENDLFRRVFIRFGFLLFLFIVWRLLFHRRSAAALSIAEGRDGKNFQNIEITTAVKPSVYGKLVPTTIKNSANLAGGENFVDIDSNTASHTVTPEWFAKEGAVYEGNQILWTITANSTRQRMYNAVITDYLSEDVQLKTETLKLGNTNISIKDDLYEPESDTEVYAKYNVNPGGSAVLKIFLPRGAANASANVQTITFITDVTAPNTAAPADPVYNNDATLETDYVGDGGAGASLTADISVTGIGVPHVSVVKTANPLTADDKRHGTVAWTIKAASNLSAYGKTTIVDTLPGDQTYLEDEIYHNGNKLDETTEPSAVISSDGRTLTITFAEPLALASQQTFTIKTKINTDAYGKNLSNKIFTNQVKVNLYSADGLHVLVSDLDTASISVTNPVIAKAASAYNGNTTKQGILPRVNFTVTVNANLMPLKNVRVTDNLNLLITEFQQKGQSSWAPVSGVKWVYVPGSLAITNATPAAGRRDSFDLASIIAAAEAAYGLGVNQLSFDFGDGVAINDKYTIAFTVELDVEQNAVFKQNGTIRMRGNVAGIEADGLDAGIISTSPTGNRTIENSVLSKSGVAMNAERQIVWTIRLNQHRVKLDNPRVVDILPAGVTLDPTSIKLYTDVIGPDGSFIADSAVGTGAGGGVSVPFDYTYLPATGEGLEGRYVLQVDLPSSETDYILRFATDIDKSLWDKPITNNACYSGETSDPENNDSATMTISGSSGGGSTSKAYLTVYKKSRDTGKPVDTASFTLHWLKGGAEPIFVRTLSTEGGALTFYGLTKGEKYTVSEINPPDGYLLDDPNPVEVVIPLGAEIPDDVTFYNTPVKTGAWQPSAIKKLTGKKLSRPFAFEIRSGAEPLMTGVTGAPLPNGDYSVAFSRIAGIDAAGLLSFTDDHIFTGGETEHLVAILALNMRETTANLPGYGFGGEIYTLIIRVYNVKGRENLKIVIEDGAGNTLSDDDGHFKPGAVPVFHNTYHADGSITLSAQKILAGHELLAGQFCFELYEGEHLLQTVENGPAMLLPDSTYTANITFDPIAYTQADAGIKTYRIVEKNTAAPGYTYDPGEYVVTVEITDNDDGTVESHIQSIMRAAEGAETPAMQVSFLNAYTAEDVDIGLTAAKTLTGRNLEDGMFSFRLREVTASGSLIRDFETVTNLGGTVVFPVLTFSQADIGQSFYYRIFEIDGGLSYYTYDDGMYALRVDVTDNHDGTLSAAQHLTKDESVADEIKFANSYHAAGDMTVSAFKTLAGKALPSEQFLFLLQAFDIVTGENIGEEHTAKNDANGEIHFAPLTFTEADAGKTFYYRVSEQDEGAPGYTYDDRVYTLTVTVTDNGDGTLSAGYEIISPKKRRTSSLPTPTPPRVRCVWAAQKPFPEAFLRTNSLPSC